MRIDTRNNEQVSDILLALCSTFPERSQDVMALCLKAKRGVVLDLKCATKRSSECGSSEYSVLIDMLIITAGDLGFRVPPAQET